MILKTQQVLFTFEQVLNLQSEPIQGDYDSREESYIYYNVPIRNVLIGIASQKTSKRGNIPCESEVAITDKGYLVTIGWIEKEEQA